MARRFYIARHGETVFNAAARMQGETLHTPLTRAGFAQAEAMGVALRGRLGPRPELALWSSPAGRAQQTLAVIAEHLELDWHQARTDERLAEIGLGDWTGLYYRDIAAELGEPLDPGTGLFTRRPPGGEWYDEVAARLQTWLEERQAETDVKLVVMHGMSSRVLRGMLAGTPLDPEHGAPIAAALPQGRIAEIVDGQETVVRHDAAPGSGGPAVPLDFPPFRPT